MFCIYKASFTFIQQIVCRHDITEILMKVVLNTILLKLCFLQNNTNYLSCELFARYNELFLLPLLVFFTETILGD